MQTLLASMCPICLNASAEMDDYLFSCVFATEIWNYFMGIFLIPRPAPKTSLREVIFAWWLHSSNNKLENLFLKILPGAIAWFLWKIYAEVNWELLTFLLQNKSFHVYNITCGPGLISYTTPNMQFKFPYYSKSA
ncbi:unnamed protein product [Cuscuta epithymum]|uniref:Reverse transcriptase zinc-binding domain-containing protein n=1 Tax=Cuscuta epithymum TaxID=186058 RepID=A0AAV0C1S5_9ASTE|nr:unnamed protein product [Cuscuta epithymum]CAH9135656.1 unnamed protein product [Cuscuta epithymum]